MSKEAMKLALEALENHAGNYKLTKDECVKHRAAENAIKEALAQPAQRTWVGLTDEDIGMCLDVGDCSMGKIIQAIEAKLKEKNT